MICPMTPILIRSLGENSSGSKAVTGKEEHSSKQGPGEKQTSPAGDWEQSG